jgi:hypothetical protein
LGYVSSTSPDAFQHRVQELAGQINIRNQSGFAGRIRIELDTNAKAFMLELGHWMSGWLSIYYADIREAAGRAWENTLRVAVVLQVFCGEESKVSRDMAERAWAIVEWSLSQHRLIFAEPGFTTTMKSVQKKQFAIPKAIRKPRPLQDAQWVLDCFGRICAGQFAQQAMVSDVCVLAGLPRKRFVAALAWLKLEGLIETDRAGQRGAVRSTASSRITAM